MAIPSQIIVTAFTFEEISIKNDPDTLMFETDEDWSRLVD